MRRTGYIFEFIPQREDPEISAFVMCRHAMWYDVEEKTKSNPKQAS
jgi:hypothetical protein